MAENLDVNINKGIASTASSVWLFTGGSIAHMAHMMGWEFIILTVVAGVVAYAISYINEKFGVIIILVGVGIFIFVFYNSRPFYFSEILNKL